MDSNAESFFGQWFSKSDRSGKLSTDELKIVDACEAYVGERFPRMRYILGTALDFILLAQTLASKDALLAQFKRDYSESKLFDRYKLVTERGVTQANTLTLRYGDLESGIRKFEELVLKYFTSERKTSYPSAYVYNTGQWAKYKELLILVFSLSSNGRYRLFEKLLEFGRTNLVTSTFRVIETQARGDFEVVLSDYKRSDADENGGLAMQALTYGYVSQVHSALRIVASKVRTGSARQKRFGDIDCYLADALTISFEVKDFELNADNYEKQIGSFVNSANDHDVRGIVVCSSYTSAVAEMISSSTTKLLSIEAMLNIVSVWDVVKQRNAISDAIHFLANIEQNESAVRRLIRFLKATPPN